MDGASNAFGYVERAGDGDHAGVHNNLLNAEVWTNAFFMVCTLETSHFERSELNFLAPRKAAESNNKEREEQRRSERVRDVKILGRKRRKRGKK